MAIKLPRLRGWVREGGVELYQLIKGNITPQEGDYYMLIPKRQKELLNCKANETVQYVKGKWVREPI